MFSYKYVFDRIFLVLLILPTLTLSLCPGSQCYTPTNPNSFNASDFELWLSLNSKADNTILQVSPGTYFVNAPTPSMRAHVILPSMSNIVLDMTSTTLIAESRTGGGIYAAGLINTTLIGLTLKYASPPSNSAVIVAIDKTAATIDITVELGHPTEDFIAGSVSSCNVFEASSRLRRPLTYDIYISSISSSTNGIYRLNVSNSGQLAGVIVGDLLGCRVPNGQMTVLLDGVINSTLKDIALFGGPCFGILESGGSRNSYINVSIRFPDPPLNATTRPLLSTSADGLHSSGARIGPRIDSIVFEGMDDDGIAIHGKFSLVTDAHNGSLWLADIPNSLQIGDALALYDPTFASSPTPEPPTYRPTLFTILSISPAASNYKPPFNISKTMPSQKLPANSYTVVTLNTSSSSSFFPIGITFDWVVANTNAVGSYYSIRNATIRNHRARGMLLKGSHGIVENSSITNSSLGGIIITPELYWEEASFAQNVSLRNNTITLTSSGIQSYGGIALGAVAPNNQLAISPGHSLITIEDNILIDAGYSPIWLNAAGNVTLRRNILRMPFHAPNASLLPNCCMPLPTQQIAVYVQSVQNVLIEENCVELAPIGENALQYLLNVSDDSNGNWINGVMIC
jgi:hypothetical protein